MIRYDETICRDFELASRREWLETNGIGGFASSTILGLNTRRYHGLLVAATKPPLGRMVLLSKLEETLVVNGRRYELGCNRYPGTIYPQGYVYLKEFRRDPFPVFVYEVDGVELEKSVFMVYGENTTVVRYAVSGGGAALEVRPLIAFRDYHSTTHENGAIHKDVAIEPGLLTCSPYDGCPSLYLAQAADEARPAGDWYRNFEYTIEQERGLDFAEDLFHPCDLTFHLEDGGERSIIASTERHTADNAAGLRSAAIARGAALTGSEDPATALLLAAADQFVVKRGRGSTVIAGYHWFSDWGRDTMIALPGLTLATGRYDEARGILEAFSGSVDRGMLPNRFPDAGEIPEYNTVDATLWFFEAVRAFAAQTGDWEFVRAQIYDVAADIVAWHERGTRYGIRVDSDGLLMAGEPGVQLTWMDAKAGDWVVTPRYGKPVEIQALWYNALRVLQGFAARFGKANDAVHYGELADRVLANFEPLFWNAAGGCLFDVVNGDSRDASVRPNQIFAVSLAHPLLTGERAAQVVRVVREQLLTPYGLRTLAASDPQYRGRFEGGPVSRDGAYHQGTVWPWLLGPLVSANLQVNRHSPEAYAEAAEWTKELLRYAADEGGGQIPEVFDGDAPHRAGGCYAQAWSVAEMLRLRWENAAALQASE